MNSRAILIPGGTRLRPVHPIERNGCCEVVYDRERNLLIEVPDEFRYYVAVALETGEPDEDLLGWLASEDLLTYDQSIAWPATHGSVLSGLVDLSLDPCGDDSFGCVCFFDDEAHCRIGKNHEERGAEVLDCLFGGIDGVSRITVHLGSNGEQLDFDWLQRTVSRIGRQAERFGKEVGYELRMALSAVDADVASLLEHPRFRVRVRCDGPRDLRRHGARGGAGSRLEVLQKHLGPRLTVHSVLTEGRVAGLWSWAQKAGLERLHVTKLENLRADRETELRDFQEDLAAVCDDMFHALHGERDRPLLYEPLIRVVRRMAHRGPVQRRAVRLGVISNGRVLPVSQQMRQGVALADASLAPWLNAGDESWASESDSGFGHHRCERCWARPLCGRGACAEPSLSGVEKVGAEGEHCDFWRIELEEGLHFFRRLQAVDPDYLLGLVESLDEGHVDPFDAAGSFIEWKTC